MSTSSAVDRMISVSVKVFFRNFIQMKFVENILVPRNNPSVKRSCTEVVEYMRKEEERKKKNAQQKWFAYIVPNQLYKTVRPSDTID